MKYARAGDLVRAESVRRGEAGGHFQPAPAIW